MISDMVATIDYYHNWWIDKTQLRIRLIDIIYLYFWPRDQNDKLI